MARRRCLVLALLLALPRMGAAHFVLRSPASWRVQDSDGNPQKIGPCGEEGTAAPSGIVTAFAPGDTVTITIDETIFHPGHYRVALAVADRSELPAEPPVTPGETACGSVPIATSPALPVLADGALEHTAPFSGSRFIQVTLPSDVTCTHCTLQVLEFMSDHPAPCFYHHCADISIAAPDVVCTTDAECTDYNVCTSDRCDLASGRCEHADTMTPTCDDGDACTRDACSPVDGCVRQPLTLADADTKFLGVLQPPSCAGARIPPSVARLFGAAATAVTRAARHPAKAGPLLRRASRKVRRAARMAERRASGECTTALGALLAEAHARVECLRRAVVN
jgi:Lytic polysaccharide mono-oxygenase, cellulose-degrading